MNLLWIAPPLLLVPAFVFWYQRKAQKKQLNSFFYEWEAAETKHAKQHHAKLLYLNDFAPEMSEKIVHVWQESGATTELLQKLPAFLAKRKSLQAKGNIDADAEFYDEECKMLDSWVPYELIDTEPNVETYIAGLNHLFFPAHLSHYVVKLSSNMPEPQKSHWLDIAKILEEWSVKLESNNQYEDVLKQKNDFLALLKQ